MSGVRFHTVAFGLGASLVLSAEQASPTLRITSPAADAIVNGPTRLEATLTPPGELQSVNFFANGRLVCTVDRAPFGCTWDAGSIVRGYHIRVVATLPGGRRLVDNVHTKNL